MRLTQKNEFFEYVLPCQNVVGDNQATEISLGETEYSCKKYIVGEAIKKLGELEDVLEEFELTSAKELRNHLNFQDNMAIWEGELNYKNKIADLEQKLAELKQNAIMSKFKVGDKVYGIIDTWAYTDVRPVEIRGTHLLYEVWDGEDTTKQHFTRIFATKEEAEQKLAEIKGE